MYQIASLDNTEGCEGGGWRFPCPTEGTGMKLGDYSLRYFTEESNWKGRGKILANNSCSSPGFVSQGLHFLISRLQFCRNFFSIVFHLGSKACRSHSEPHFLKASRRVKPGTVCALTPLSFTCSTSWGGPGADLLQGHTLVRSPEGVAHRIMGSGALQTLSYSTRIRVPTVAQWTQQVVGFAIQSPAPVRRSECPRARL